MAEKTLQKVVFLLLIGLFANFNGYGKDNTAPTVEIKSPENGSRFFLGEKITFEGKALDLEDGPITGGYLVWTSDIDNIIGRGVSFVTDKLSSGSHIIMLTGTDSKGGSGRDSVFIIVEVPVKPSIEFTYVPKYGTTDDLKGKVSNIKPEDFRVAVYIMVDGAWWTKPYWDSPLTEIKSDSTWLCDITTGGIDEVAEKIVAYLVPAAYKPPLATGSLSLAKELEEKGVAKTQASRLPAKPLVQVTPKIDKPLGKLKGLGYGPFRDNENPDMGVFPLFDELEKDLQFIPKIARAIRIYGCTNTPGSIPQLCEKMGIDCYAGAWVDKYKTESEKEIESIIRIADKNLKCLRGLIIGNEVLLRKDITEKELIELIRKVKSHTALPVTTAEIWSAWIKHPRLADEVDFLMVHIHPYWEGIAVEKAAAHVVELWKHLKVVFPGKRVVIGETGWPSSGKKIDKAVPSEENQARFLREFVQLADKEGIEYFYFELFDEKWKDKFEGEAGAHWGIYNSNGSLKPKMVALIPVEGSLGISRPARKVLPAQVSAPLVVYSDAGSEENRFQPSGWLGDLKCIDLDRECETNPYSGQTCVRITYAPAGFFSLGWAGIYWQYPLNNWGQYPGYKASGIEKLTFWVRGENGGEQAEFKVGGIGDSQFPHRDSFGPVSTGIIKLTRNWEKYTIELKGKDTSSLIGGFCWVTNSWQNPRGCTIYLDDIRLE